VADAARSTRPDRVGAIGVADDAPHLRAQRLTKVFGPDPASVLPLLEQGMDKDEVLARTGHTVGLHDVSIEVARGETFVVMGLSGSGKSTLVRCLNRLIDPTAGTLELDGSDLLGLGLRALREVRRHRIGMVFQRFALLPHRNVIDNVAFGLRVQGVPRPERARRAAAWVERVGLTGYERALPRELSGGMQQRVGLARALCTDPEVLLMDEAFSALDPLIRREMQGELMRLQRELVKTVVFITHDLDEALRLGDRVAILKDGRLVQVGTPVEIVTRPADDYVRAFVEDVDRARVLRARDALAFAVAPSTEGAAEATGQVDAQATLGEALATIAAGGGPVRVTAPDGRTLGVLDATAALRALTERAREGQDGRSAGNTPRGDDPSRPAAR
jgi:glycine betaine/proline transport system ATP-binding protein